MGKKNKGKPDYWLLLSVLALLGIGLVMIYSASSVATLTDYNDPYYYLNRQGLWAGLGLFTMAVMSRISYRQWNRWALPVMGVSIILLLCVLHPSIGRVVNGARRWIEIGGQRFQPSEFAKLALIIFTASGLSKNRHKLKNVITGRLSYVILAGGICGLILLQPDLGTAVAIGGTAFIMWFAAGFPILYLGGLVFLSVPILRHTILMEEYRRNRLLSFLDPWADPLGDGYHIIQSLLALGSGGLFGVGLGNSRQKLFYLPERHTDFIFSILGEELGLLGAAGVILLFLLFAFRGYRIAVMAPNMFSSLLAVGITTMICLQAGVNIGVVSGSIPITGITLPFISYGGSSLIPALAGVGILLNISQHTKAAEENE